MELRGARVLVFGTAGSQGAGLAELAAELGAVPVRVSSDPERVAAWRRAGRQAELADLTRPDTIAAVAAGARAAVLHPPASIDPSRRLTALLFSVGVLRDAGLRVVVSVGGPVPPAHVPDVLGVRTLAEVLVGDGATILAPTAYLESYAAPWALGSLLAGELVSHRPHDAAVAWLSARDVNRAALAALAGGIEGEVIPLAGPAVLSFAHLARELGAGIGRPLSFRRIRAVEFERLLGASLGPTAAALLSVAHGEADALPAGVTPGSWQRLGLVPTPAAEWAASHLAPLLPVPRRPVRS